MKFARRTGRTFLPCIRYVNVVQKRTVTGYSDASESRAVIFGQLRVFTVP